MVLEVVVNIYSLCLNERIVEYLSLHSIYFSFILACCQSSLDSSILLTMVTNFIIPRDALIVVPEVTILAVVIMFSYKGEKFLPTSSRKKE